MTMASTATATIKQTGVAVDLKGVDGNVFSIMGLVTKTMRRAGVSAEVIDTYRKEAMSGDYDHALQVTCAYVDVQWGANDMDEDGFEDEDECGECGNRLSDCCCDDEEDEDE
jgi:hypothetical protein